MPLHSRRGVRFVWRSRRWRCVPPRPLTPADIMRERTVQSGRRSPLVLVSSRPYRAWAQRPAAERLLRAGLRGPADVGLVDATLPDVGSAEFAACSRRRFRGRPPRGLHGPGGMRAVDKCRERSLCASRACPELSLATSPRLSDMHYGQHPEVVQSSYCPPHFQELAPTAGRWTRVRQHFEDGSRWATLSGAEAS